MGFSRQEYWSGLPLLSPGDLPNPVIKPMSLMSPALAGRFFTTRATWEARFLGRLLNLCCFSVAQLCLTLCDPVDCTMPVFPVLYHLLELVQAHVHRVRDAIQPSHPLSSPLLLPSIFPSIRVFSRVSSVHQVAKVLELQLQFFQLDTKQ